ncbi:MAG TPA: hypothetical protein PKD72_10840, partial [Gemmatales bacterium]|nr:hypothetical protein [Gemmatales bacterium]
EVRHEQRTGTGNLESPLAAYNREQVLKLNDLEAAMKQTLEDAKAGKVLAAPPPPTPAPPANPTPANPNPATPPAK